MFAWTALGQMSVISWKDSRAPGLSCRKHSAASAFRDGLSIPNKPSSEQGNLSSIWCFWYLSRTSGCPALSPSPPATPGFLQGSGELFLCRSKPQEHSPVSLPLKLLSGSSARTFGKGGGQACSLLFLRKVFSQLFCSPGPHLPSSACLGGNFPLSHASKKIRDICVCHQFGLTPT